MEHDRTDKVMQQKVRNIVKGEVLEWSGTARSQPGDEATDRENHDLRI